MDSDRRSVEQVVLPVHTHLPVHAAVVALCMDLVVPEVRAGHEVVAPVGSWALVVAAVAVVAVVDSDRGGVLAEAVDYYCHPAQAAPVALAVQRFAEDYSSVPVAFYRHT